MSPAPKQYAPNVQRECSAFKALWNAANHGGCGAANFWKKVESVQPSVHEVDLQLEIFRSPLFRRFRFPLISWRSRENGSVACSRAHQSKAVDHISHLGVDLERGHRLVVERPINTFC